MINLSNEHIYRHFLSQDRHAIANFGFTPDGRLCSAALRRITPWPRLDRLAAGLGTSRPGRVSAARPSAQTRTLAPFACTRAAAWWMPLRGRSAPSGGDRERTAERTVASLPAPGIAGHKPRRATARTRFAPWRTCAGSDESSADGAEAIPQHHDDQSEH